MYLYNISIFFLVVSCKSTALAGYHIVILMSNSLSAHPWTVNIGQQKVEFDPFEKSVNPPQF